MDEEREVMVVAYPYALTRGRLKVPKSVTDLDEYVAEHFSDISFDEPELDFRGTDFEVYEE